MFAPGASVGRFKGDQL